MLELVRARLGGEAAFIVPLEAWDDMEKAILRAEAEGIKELWVGGGDGTIGRVAKFLMGKSTVLGILPLGTGNALARELGIPIKTDSAISFLQNDAVAMPLDLATCNDRAFITIATLGITTHIAEELKSEAKRRYGRLAYLGAFWRAIKAFRTYHVVIEADGKHFAGRVAQVVVSNSRLHSGPFAVTDNASASDGLLSIYAVAQEDRRGFFKFLWAFLRGRQTQLENVWSTEAQRVTITCRRRQKFILDGDPYKAQRVEIQSVRHAIQVFARPE